MSKTTITVKMRADGTVVGVLSDGSERPFPQTPMRPMTEAEIAEARISAVRRYEGASDLELLTKRIARLAGHQICSADGSATRF